MSDPQSYCPFCKRTHDAPEFIEALMSDMSKTIRRFPTYLPSGLHTEEIADEIERLTAESEAYRQEYVRLGCENVKLQARAAELEAALRGYVKATTGQESATVTFPMALEGEVK